MLLDMYRFAVLLDSTGEAARFKVFFETWSRIDDDFSSALILLGLKVKVFVGVDPERLVSVQ